jgi:membrane glycosyltransferase
LLERSTRDLSQFLSASPSFAGRRLLFAALVLASIAAMLWLMGTALAADGFGILDALILFMFGVTLPWTVIGFWNAAIGFLILRLTDDASQAVMPAAARIRGDEPIAASTAIVMCIRNEVPERVVRNIEPLMAELAAGGFGDRFHMYILSDTSLPDVGAAEEQTFDALAARWKGRLEVTYRRRAVNTGFKAGNIRDFCDRWGSQHEFAVTLDTDSLMPGSAVLRLVRLMQSDPKLGIVQSLVIGLPTVSAFARIFQFGMRLSMRCYTIGSAWWQADCGPYWGHNAIVRLAPFIQHCQLPIIEGGSATAGHVLSHDQLEAALMRRAGYEVRVLPEEDLGWEENPPTLVEFIRRDLRWCQGNMQYWHLLRYPGLRPVSRYQLVFAIMMFLGSPAWVGMLLLGTLMIALAGNPAAIIDTGIGKAVFFLTLIMWFAPTYSTAIDILLRSDQRRAFGGALVFCVSFLVSVLFSIVLVPIMWFGHTVFLIGLLFGRTIGWIGQVRDDHSVPLALAARNFWPHTVFGWGAIAVLAATYPAAIPYALCIVGGPAISIPLAVVTAMPAVGNALTRIGIGRLPEETAPPHLLATLALPAVRLAGASRKPA